MLHTYEAVLEGDCVRWTGEKPPADQPVRVHVTVLGEQEQDVPRGVEMAEALEKLAEMGAFSEIEDPSAWQREIRKDRTLPDPHVKRQRHEATYR